MGDVGPILLGVAGVLGVLCTAWTNATANRSKAGTTNYRDATRRLGLLRRVMSLVVGTPAFEGWPTDLREALNREVLGEPADH